MEVVKYLCEFFFEDFVHFLMLVFLCWTASPKINNITNPFKFTNKNDD